MKLKAFILGLFVFAIAATTQAQHTSNHGKHEKIEKPVKYKGDKKVVSRKQSQSKATTAKRKKISDNKMLKAKKHEKVAYKKDTVAKKQAIRTKKHQLRKAKYKPTLKQAPATH